METEVTCPDCGKVIAPPGAVDSALRCRCGEKRGPKVTVDEVSSRPNISVPIPDLPPKTHHREEEDHSPAAVARRAKTCYICGTSLEGRVRLKDHLGRYWCKECAAADERAKRREAESRCADCSRVFPPHKLKYFQTDKVCASCFKVREKELEQKILKANLNKTEKTHEWAQVKRLAIIAGVLILLGTIGLVIHLL
jgi:hypothetical protein